MDPDASFLNNVDRHARVAAIEYDLSGFEFDADADKPDRIQKLGPKGIKKFAHRSKILASRAGDNSVVVYLKHVAARPFVRMHIMLSITMARRKKYSDPIFLQRRLLLPCRLTRYTPAATKVIAIRSCGVSGSPSMSHPASTPKIGVRKVKEASLGAG